MAIASSSSSVRLPPFACVAKANMSYWFERVTQWPYSRRATQFMLSAITVAGQSEVPLSGFSIIFAA
jgi:hypothetical protein